MRQFQIIEPVRSVQTEDRKDKLEVIQEPKIEEDNGKICD